MLSVIVKVEKRSLQKTGVANEEITYDNIQKYFNFNLNIKNLEIEVSDVYSLVNDNRYVFEYSEKEDACSDFFEYNLPNLDYDESECLIYNDEEYSLWLPLYSSVLNKVGRQLNICIASYAEKIVKQQAVLLLVKKGAYYIGCIELDCKYETLIQAKIRYNKKFNEAEQDFIYRFCIDNDIEICTNDMISDYNTIEDYGLSVVV